MEFELRVQSSSLCSGEHNFSSTSLHTLQPIVLQSVLRLCKDTFGMHAVVALGVKETVLGCEKWNQRGIDSLEGSTVQTTWTASRCES